MQIQIDGLTISIVKLDAHQMLFVGESNIPYFMRWNKENRIWQFTDTTIPFDLRVHEMVISDFIISSEQQ